MHTVCCRLTEDFLAYSKAQGNDLTTPMPQYGFAGLSPGDQWCVCAPNAGRRRSMPATRAA